jgi:hypothetical protein
VAEEYLPRIRMPALARLRGELAAAGAPVPPIPEALSAAYKRAAGPPPSAPLPAVPGGDAAAGTAAPAAAAAARGGAARSGAVSRGAARGARLFAPHAARAATASALSGARGHAATAAGGVSCPLPWLHHVQALAAGHGAAAQPSWPLAGVAADDACGGCGPLVLPLGAAAPWPAASPLLGLTRWEGSGGGAGGAAVACGGAAPLLALLPDDAGGEGGADSDAGDLVEWFCSAVGLAVEADADDEAAPLAPRAAAVPGPGAASSQATSTAAGSGARRGDASSPSVSWGSARAEAPAAVKAEDPGARPEPPAARVWSDLAAGSANTVEASLFQRWAAEGAHESFF